MGKIIKIVKLLEKKSNENRTQKNHYNKNHRNAFEIGERVEMRYYYTDSLAAAWNAKYHGMKFVWESDGLPIAPLLIEKMGVKKPYIAQDSLHLLEPQIGDLFTMQRGLMRADETMYPKQGGGWEPGACYRLVDGYNRYFPDAWGDEKKIIQRGGIPFMMPQREETP